MATNRNRVSAKVKQKGRLLNVSNQCKSRRPRDSKRLNAKHKHPSIDSRSLSINSRHKDKRLKDSKCLNVNSLLRDKCKDPTLHQPVVLVLVVEVADLAWAVAAHLAVEVAEQDDNFFMALN